MGGAKDHVTAMPFSHITGTGSFLPSRVVANKDLVPLVRIDEEGIKKRTGISERREASPDQAASDLGSEAALEALKAAGYDPGRVDYIIVSTTSPDMFIPSTACLIQKNIGAVRAVGFDIAASCSGFLYALSIADQYIKTGSASSVLVVASEVKSRFVNPHDPSTAILFGDGAGAVLLEGGGEGRGILSLHLHSDGSRGGLIQIPGGGSRHPTTERTLQKGLHYIQMRGQALYRVAVSYLEKAIDEVLAYHRLPLSDITCFIFHQANRRILETVASRKKIPLEKVVMTLEYCGNTSSSSPAIALDRAVKEKRITRGDLVLLAAFGGGVTWGSALIRW